MTGAARPLSHACTRRLSRGRIILSVAASGRFHQKHPSPLLEARIVGRRRKSIRIGCFVTAFPKWRSHAPPLYRPDRRDLPPIYRGLHRSDTPERTAAVDLLRRDLDEILRTARAHPRRGRATSSRRTSNGFITGRIVETSRCGASVPPTLLIEWQTTSLCSRTDVFRVPGPSRDG
jgi:hypothetical protein